MSCFLVSTRRNPHHLVPLPRQWRPCRHPPHHRTFSPHPIPSHCPEGLCCKPCSRPPVRNSDRRCVRRDVVTKTGAWPVPCSGLSGWPGSLVASRPPYCKPHPQPRTLPSQSCTYTTEPMNRLLPTRHNMNPTAITRAASAISPAGTALSTPIPAGLPADPSKICPPGCGQGGKDGCGSQKDRAFKDRVPMTFPCVSPPSILTA